MDPAWICFDTVSCIEIVIFVIQDDHSNIVHNVTCPGNIQVSIRTNREKEMFPWDYRDWNPSYSTAFNNQIPGAPSDLSQCSNWFGTQVQCPSIGSELDSLIISHGPGNSWVTSARTAPSEKLISEKWLAQSKRFSQACCPEALLSTSLSQHWLFSTFWKGNADHLSVHVLVRENLSTVWIVWGMTMSISCNQL